MRRPENNGVRESKYRGENSAAAAAKAHEGKSTGWLAAAAVAERRRSVAHILYIGNLSVSMTWPSENACG